MYERMLQGWVRSRKKICVGLYLLALAVVLAGAAAPVALHAAGLRQPRALTLADFEAVGTQQLDETTLVTATDDAQLHLPFAGAHSLWVRCEFSLDPGEFVLFYQNRAGAEFSAGKMLHAQRYGDWYVFTPPAGTQKIRLDLGVYPSITVHFDEIVLDRYTGFSLDTGALVWAALLPGTLCALISGFFAMCSGEKQVYGETAANE